MAFRPPSVIQGAPSGPTITPWGAEPGPSGISRTSPVAGSSQPSPPEPWAVYQTPPSRAGARSWGRELEGTGCSCIAGSAGDGGAEGSPVVWGGAVASAERVAGGGAV